MTLRITAIVVDLSADYVWFTTFILPWLPFAIPAIYAGAVRAYNSRIPVKKPEIQIVIPEGFFPLTDDLGRPVMTAGFARRWSGVMGAGAVCFTVAVTATVMTIGLGFETNTFFPPIFYIWPIALELVGALMIRLSVVRIIKNPKGAYFFGRVAAAQGASPTKVPPAATLTRDEGR